MAFQFGQHHLPEFQYPEGYDGDSLFAELCQKGFEKRYPDASEEYRERLRYEMEMIRRMGFVDYFLIVADFVAYAREPGHSGGARTWLRRRFHGVLLFGHHQRRSHAVRPVL